MWSVWSAVGGFGYHLTGLWCKSITVMFTVCRFKEKKVRDKNNTVCVITSPVNFIQICCEGGQWQLGNSQSGSPWFQWELKQSQFSNWHKLNFKLNRGKADRPMSASWQQDKEVSWKSAGKQLETAWKPPGIWKETEWFMTGRNNCKWLHLYAFVIVLEELFTRA